MLLKEDTEAYVKKASGGGIPMNTRLKKVVFLGFVIIIIISCISLCIYFQPKPLIKDIHSCAISRIAYKGTEITDEAAHKNVLQVLIRYKSRASFEQMHSYPIENAVVEIDGTDNSKPFHIVLGKNNFKYEHAGGIIRKIIYGDRLLEDLEKILVKL